MDTQVLVTDTDLYAIADFTSCLRQSQKLGLFLVSLIWDDDCQFWRLIVASSLHKKSGPIAAYTEINVCLASLEDSSIRLDQIESVPYTENIVVAIRQLYRDGISYLDDAPYEQPYKRVANLSSNHMLLSKVIIFYSKQIS